MDRDGYISNGELFQVNCSFASFKIEIFLGVKDDGRE